MKRLFLLMLSLFSTLIFSENMVTVYSSRHYDVDKKIFTEFEKQTGIKVVEVSNRDVNALIKKMQLEGKKTDADVFLTVGIGDLNRAKKLGLLSEINSKEIFNNVSKEFFDKDKYWVGITYRARILVYNPEKVNENELSTYEDLANSKWRGKILTRSSNSSYNQHLLAFMIAKNGEAKATKWAKGLVDNFARDPKGNDRDQAKAVLAGIGDIAIMNSYYMGRMSVSKDPIEKEVASKLKIFFPNQDKDGTHINISGAAITSYAKNRENAVKLIEFLTSKEVQEILSLENFEYPTNPNAKISPVVEAWGKFKPSKVSFNSISRNMENAKKVSSKVNWK